MLDQLRRFVPASVKRAATDRDFWFRARINLLTRPMYAGLGSILALHRICPAPARSRLGFNRDLEITPELLEETIVFFKQKGYDFVSLDQIHDRLLSGQPGKRFVAFTLDDGYRDNLTHALPIFRSHNVPFTVYVTTCFPHRKAVLWWYILEDLLWDHDEVEIELNGERVSFDCATLAEREAAFDTIAGHLTFARNEHEQKKILRSFTGDFSSHVQQLGLSWEELGELSREPLVTIGAHSSNHLALSMQSPAGARGEILNSKEELEERTGKTVQHFAYPFGGRRAAGPREFQLVKECGFKTATTTRNGNIFASHKYNLECLPRIPVSSGELRKNIGYLNLWLDGLVPCHENSFQRVVTI